MKIAAIVLAGIFGAILMTGMWCVGTYNGLVTKNEAVNSAWAQVQNVYQRRADLVPNLVETVKGAANFEKTTFTEVAKARSSVGQFTVDKSILNNPEQFAKFQQSQGMLGSALNKLMVVMEKYPDLQATQNFKDLQVQLEGTENRITVERKGFNDTAMEYNMAIKRFPGSIIAGFGGFKEKVYFQADAEAQTAVKVKF
jgi:LemA protein